MPERHLLLDTCALVWLVAGSRKLSAAARQAVDRADIVYVSAISAWEVSLKVAKNQLRLPLPPSEWYTRALTQHNLTAAPLTIDVLIEANELPWHHRDPADRFIIASARRLGATVVTTDQRFSLYSIAVIG